MAAKDEQDGVAVREQFAAQGTTVEDELKSQTVGLVSLSDFRKRRAEIAEQKELESRNASGRGTPLLSSGVSTPQDGRSSPKPAAKKRKKTATTGKLSFGLDEEDEDAVVRPKLQKAAQAPEEHPGKLDDAAPSTSDHADAVRKMKPNASIPYAPKSMTKSAMIKDAEAKEKFRRDGLAMRDRVRNTDILVPFVFHDGKDVPGSVCKMKKGDSIWLFLDRARKFGAERGASGADKVRRDWARISTDDLMLVRDDIIIPHHLDFYHFIHNKYCGYQGLLFDYSDNFDDCETHENGPPGSSVSTHGSKPENESQGIGDAREIELEGKRHDPHKVKVVDRRWYDKNKHIFPASTWEDFDEMKDYTTGARRDKGGNAYFFS